MVLVMVTGLYYQVVLTAKLTVYMYK